MQMPVLGGVEATKALRLREADLGGGERVRVVGLTGEPSRSMVNPFLHFLTSKYSADAREAALRAGQEAGMDAVLTFPYRLAAILDAVSE